MLHVAIVPTLCALQKGLQQTLLDLSVDKDRQVWDSWEAGDVKLMEVLTKLPVTRDLVNHASDAV